MSRNSAGPLASLTQWIAATTGVLLVSGTIIGGSTNVDLAAGDPGLYGAGPGAAEVVPGTDTGALPAPVVVAPPPPLAGFGQGAGPLGGAPELGPILQGSATDSTSTGSGTAVPTSFTDSSGSLPDLGSGLSSRPASAEEAFDRASYNADIGGAAVGAYIKAPYYAVMGSPYSEGTLRKVVGSIPESEALGAGYWLSVAVEEGILGPGFDPTGNGGGAGYKNPTYARATYPKDKKTNTPTVPSAPAGLQWTAKCPSGLVAEADGKQANIDVGGQAAVMSAITHSITTMDKRARTITSVSDSATENITSGVVLIKSFRSSLKVVQTGDGRRPRISYTLTVAGVTANGMPIAQFGGDGVTLAGTNVPADAVVSQFNDQLNAHHDAVAALGDYKFSFLAPVVEFKGIKTSVVSPVLSGGLAANAREGSVGQEQGIRLGDSRFDGYYITL